MWTSNVVLEEIAMRDDDPEDLLHEMFVETVMPNHPLGRSILGTEQSITMMTPSALRSFYRRRYRLQRMVLAVAGNVEHRAVVRMVESALRGRLSGSDTPRPPRGGQARFGRSVRPVLYKHDTEQTHLMLGVRTPGRHDERRYRWRWVNVPVQDELTPVPGGPRAAWRPTRCTRP